MSTGVSEYVTHEELHENRKFLDAILDTDVMKVPKWTVEGDNKHAEKDVNMCCCFALTVRSPVPGQEETVAAECDEFQEATLRHLVPPVPP